MKRLILFLLAYAISCGLASSATVCPHLPDRDVSSFLAKVERALGGDDSAVSGLSQFIRAVVFSPDNTAPNYVSVNKILALGSNDAKGLTRHCAKFGDADKIAFDAHKGLDKILANRTDAGLASRMSKDFHDGRTLESVCVAVNEIEDFSHYTDDAVHGMGVAQKALGATDDGVLIIVKGDGMVGDRAAKAFSNFEALKDVDGLPEFVKYTKEAAGFAANSSGALLEGAVARELKAGRLKLNDSNVPSGGLQRIAVDRTVPELNKADLISENWFVQAKFTSSKSLAFGGNLNQDYLVRLKAQADSIGKTPVLSTNASELSAGLLDACRNLGIGVVTNVKL